MKPHLDSDSTPILIVGGGLAGLSSALFLAWRGVPCVLVERHAGSSPHPRAMGFTTRTLELFRAVGLGDDIAQVPQGFGRPRRVQVESLAGRWEEEIAWSPSQPKAAKPGQSPQSVEYSPCTGAAIAQDKLEPILREKARQLGADIRMSTELVSFEQATSGVTARLRPRDGTEYTLHAQYLVAADGHRSPVRQSLGIGRSGHGVMQTVRSVLFRASLDEYLEAGISQFAIVQPELQGMLTTYRDNRWVLMFNDDEDRDEATLRQKVLAAIGRTDREIELITTGRWVLSALIADRFSSGRVFLIGDAAHTLPPARGGYGANTGIEDASNVAWKLAAVVRGISGAELLETYDAERRPVAWLRHGQIFARPDYAKWATDAEKSVSVIEDDAMELGQLYRSSAVLGAGDELPPARRPDQWSGQPGTRAPHLWLTSSGVRTSSLDVLQRAWTLVSVDVRWLNAGRCVAESRGVRIETLGGGADGAATVSHIVTDAGELAALAAAFGVGDAGAALVRPDGYIAWRSLDAVADPEAAFEAALVQAAALSVA